jgi:hypothetical protein
VKYGYLDLDWRMSGWGGEWHGRIGARVVPWWQGLGREAKKTENYTGRTYIG